MSIAGRATADRVEYAPVYRYQPLLFQPVPSRPAYAFSEVMEEVRASVFPAVEERVEVRIVAESALASIRHNFMGRDRHLVVFHAVLNHPETPIEVVRFICKHELTHIVRPGRLIDGWYESHPPEFWEHEQAVGPESYAVWAWVRRNLHGCVRHGRSGVSVGGRWRALRDTPRVPYTPALPFDGERWERVCPDDGAQLRLPPDGAVRPLPFGARDFRLASGAARA